MIEAIKDFWDVESHRKWVVISGVCVIGVAVTLWILFGGKGDVGDESDSGTNGGNVQPITPDGNSSSSNVAPSVSPSPTVNADGVNITRTPTTGTAGPGESFIEVNGIRKVFPSREQTFALPEDTEGLGMTDEERAEFLSTGGLTLAHMNAASEVARLVAEPTLGDNEQKRRARYGNLVNASASIFSAESPTAPPEGAKNLSAVSLYSTGTAYNGFYVADDGKVYMKVQTSYWYQYQYEQDGVVYKKSGTGAVSVVLPYFTKDGTIAKDVFFTTSNE